MLRSDLCDLDDAYIVGKGNIILDKKNLLLKILMSPTILNNTTIANAILILQMIMRLVKKSWFLKTMLHSSTAIQKLMECKVTTQKI